MALQEDSTEENCKVSQIKDFPKEEYTYDIEKYSPTLPIYIKKMEVNHGLSKYLFESDNIEYTIEGPIGQGLEMNKKFNQTHYFFVSGMGIIRIIDFLDYLLKQSMYLIIKKEFGDQEAQYFNPYNEDYDGTFGKQFKIILYANFSKLSDFIGLEIMAKLYHINKEYKLNRFDLSLRFSEQNKNEFTLAQKNLLRNITIRQEKFHQELIEKILSNPKLGRVYLCGGQQFVHEIISIFMNQNCADKVVIL